MLVNKKKTFTEEEELIARLAKALGHPVRIAIIHMLLNQKCCYHGDMSEIIPVAKSTLSQHLSELKDAGLIKGTITLPTIKYCINAERWALTQKLFGDLFSMKNNVESCEV